MKHLFMKIAHDAFAVVAWATIAGIGVGALNAAWRAMVSDGKGDSASLLIVTLIQALFVAFAFFAAKRAADAFFPCKQSSRSRT